MNSIGLIEWGEALGGGSPGGGGTPTTQDKDLSPLATMGNDSPTGIFITDTPQSGSYVTVFIGPMAADVGDGVLTKDCYFGAVAGVAKTFSTVVAGDQLFWNGLIAGYNLAPTDNVDLSYDT